MSGRNVSVSFAAECLGDWKDLLDRVDSHGPAKWCFEDHRVRLLTSNLSPHASWLAVRFATSAQGMRDAVLLGVLCDWAHELLGRCPTDPGHPVLAHAIDCAREAAQGLGAEQLRERLVWGEEESMRIEGSELAVAAVVLRHAAAQIAEGAPRDGYEVWSYATDILNAIHSQLDPAAAETAMAACTQTLAAALGEV